MSSVTASCTLTQLCFPDITGATIKAWFLLTIGSGNYTTGGIPMGLFSALDKLTVNVAGFLKASINSEEPFSISGATGQYTYQYSPVGDVLQIFGPGTVNGPGVGPEISGAIPAEVLADTIIVEATCNRTEMLG